MVLDPHPEVGQATILVETLLQLAAGVFDKHQILTIEQGELLFVFALHSSLDRGLQRVFNRVDQIGNREVFHAVLQTDQYLRG